MWRIAGAAVALVLGAGAAPAADCANPANQAELDQCSSAAADKAESDRTAAYGQLIAVLGSDDQARLADAERAWLAFRDAECEFRTRSYVDGSIYPTLVAKCIAGLTAARAAELTAQANCGEADLCPPHVAAAPDSSGPENLTGACSKSAGAKRAQLYISQCIEVSPATHPPCNIENSCGLMIDEIKRGCASRGAAAPAFCATYLGEGKAN